MRNFWLLLTLTHRNVGWILDPAKLPRQGLISAWRRHIVQCWGGLSTNCRALWCTVHRYFPLIYYEQSGATTLRNPVKYERIWFHFASFALIALKKISITPSQWKENEKRKWKNSNTLTFEIVEGSSRKLSLDDNALPVHGIKILNIIRWIRKRFDPVLVVHHGLGKMSRISENHLVLHQHQNNREERELVDRSVS